MDVETESGSRLGKVVDLVLDNAGAVIKQYEVGFRFKSKNRLLISPDQIVRFEKDKIIVKDTFSSITESIAGVVENNEIGIEPISMMK